MPAVMADTIPRVDSVGIARWRNTSFAIKPGMMNPITWNPGSSPVNGPTINSMAMVSVIAASIVTAKRRRPKRIVNREAYRMSAAVARAIPIV